MAAGGGSKRRYQYCSDNSGTILYLRALQGHSGSNLIDPTLQDNVLFGTGIFPYIYHVGCTFNLHSIINNGLVPRGQNLSKRQTVFFLPIDPRDESHRDPERTDFSVPRLARYMHSAWKNTCSQIVLKCLYLARIGRPDILWSVNKLARSITKWTKACDKRLNRLISYIHHTCEYKQYCHVGNTAKQCRLGLFQDSDFAGDLEDSKSTSGGTMCFRQSHICSNKLDVQETDVSFSQLNRI